MLWQLEDEAGAKRCLEEFVGTWSPEEKHAREARLILEAIADPDSTSSVVAHYDRAIRNNQTSCRLDLVFWDMQRIIGKAEKLPFKRYVDDMSVGREDRAQMMYRLAYANFHSGYGGKAFLLAGEILEKWQPEGVTRHQCLYMRAHLLGRISRWKEAVPIWRQLIEQEKAGFDILRKAYLEYARALDMSGDSMGAVFALEELQARYPKAREAEVAKEWETAFLETDTSLVAHVEEQRPIIIAKWKDKPESLREVVDVPVPDAPAVAKAGGAE